MADFRHASQQGLFRVLTCSCCGRSDRTVSPKHWSCLLKPPALERGLVIQADRHRTLENPEMASLLIHQLQTIAAQGLETNQLGSAVAATRELAALLGIGKNNQHGHPTHYYRR